MTLLIRHRTVQLILAIVLVFAMLAPGLYTPPGTEAVGLYNVYGAVNSSTLNLRKAPWGTIIRSLPYGTALTVTGTNGDWFKVKALGSTGYVSSWYVKLKGTPSISIYRGNTSRKMVALTFDAGSDLGYTGMILDTLSAHGVIASFGLTGNWVDAYPDYAGWIAAEGHQIINHTVNHPSYTGFSTGSGALSPARRLSQLEVNEGKIVAYAGVYSKPYWRPPYGDIDSGVLRDVGADGYSITVMWSIDTMGWNGASTNAIYSKVMNNVGNGSIILMHVGSSSLDGPALARIITDLRNRGYAFGTVAQVIA